MSASKKTRKMRQNLNGKKINAMKKAEFKGKKDECDKKGRKINGADDEMRDFWCLKTFLISRFLR